MAEKLDSTGKPFRVRERGGKRVHQQKIRQERVDQGLVVPLVWWDSERVERARGSKSLPEAPTPENPKRSRTRSPARPSSEATSLQLRPAPGASAAVEGFSEGGVGSAGSSSVVSLFPHPKDSGSKHLSESGKAELRPNARVEHRSSASSSSTLETSFRVVSDYHGVLDRDTGSSFSRSAQQVIRSFLRQSVFHQFLILSYIGVHGHSSADRRARLRREADEFRNSLPPDQASRFGVLIVRHKQDKAWYNKVFKPVLFVDDQEWLVEASRPFCSEAKQITPNYTLEQALAEVQGYSPTVTPFEWTTHISANIR